MAKSPIYISSRIFIPAKKVDQDLLEKYYSFQNYNESTCNSCKIYKDGERHSATCDECPAYLGIAELWKNKKIKSQDYIGLPPGRPARVEKIFNINLDRAIDLRPDIPLHPKLKFTGKLYDGSVIDGRQTVDQIQVIKDWLKNSNGAGLIKIPPRGGKSTTSIALAIHLGLKTVIIANKFQLLNQFYDTIMGSKTRKAVTNAKELEQKLNKPVVVLVKKLSDLSKDCDFLIVNYQKFIRNPNSIKRIYDHINSVYGTIVADEAHGQGAAAYLKFISRLNCRYRISLSATPRRKDGNDKLAKEFMGDIAAESNVVAMIPRLELVETGVYVKHKYRLWVYAMKHLAANKQRNIMIVKDVFKDLRAGHHSIIIPVDLVAHGQKLMKMINRQAEINNIKRKENWPIPMATFLTSAFKKSEEAKIKLLADVDKGKFKVMIAIRIMIREGVDLANPTMLYNIVPCSGKEIAEGSPLFYQLGNRVCTWTKGKKQPVVKIYLDGISQSFGCLRSLWFVEILKRLKATSEGPQRYKIDDADKNRIFQILKSKEYMPVNAPGQRMTSKQILKLEKPANRRGFSSF